MEKFHLIFNRFNFILFVNQTTFEKESYLKDLVIKLLRNGNLSDFDMLDSLFEEIKQELSNPDKASNSA
jgi:hypothetical protein